MAQSNMRRARRLRRRLKVGGTGRVALVACAAAVALALVAFVVRAGHASSFEVSRSDGGSAGTSSAPEPSSQATAASVTCVVHVDGAVANPGVYTLSGEVVRVNDAVGAAGGLLEDADTAGINLASPVVDGSKVHIPHADEASSASASPASPATGSASGQASLVNINSADIAALDTLPGVGASTAQSIVRDREQNGPFTSVEDLMRVSGIGQKKFDKIKDLICV